MPKIKCYKCDVCDEIISYGFLSLKATRYCVYRGIMKDRKPIFICDKCQYALTELIKSERERMRERK